MSENKIDKEELAEYLAAMESQLDNVFSSPIGTDDYSMPSIGEMDETIFLENVIVDTIDQLDLIDDEDDAMKNFFE